jgi:translation elongation factor EF-Ts
MAVTIATIKENIQQSDLDAISGGSDTVIQNCLTKAQTFVNVYETNSGKEFAEAVKDDVIINITLCNLFRYSQDYQISAEYKEDAMTILEAAAGISSDAQKIKPKTPTAHVVPGRTDWNGF